MMSKMMMGKPMLDEGKREMIDEEILMKIMEIADQLLHEKGMGMKEGLSVEVEGIAPKDPIAAGQLEGEEDEDLIGHY